MVMEKALVPAGFSKKILKGLQDKMVEIRSCFRFPQNKGMSIWLTSDAKKFPKYYQQFQKYSFN